MVFLRANGDELHIDRLEDYVAGIADPNVTGEVHEIDRPCGECREHTQGQLSPQTPVQCCVTHRYRCCCTYSHT